MFVILIVPPIVILNLVVASILFVVPIVPRVVIVILNLIVILILFVILYLVVFVDVVESEFDCNSDSRDFNSDFDCRSL